jgi:hypothetical protein
MPTPLARRRDARPVLYTHYVEDKDYQPDPDSDPDGEPGWRPLRFQYNPTKYMQPAEREDSTPFTPAREDWGAWIPNFVNAYRSTSGLHRAARQAGVAAQTVLRFRRCSQDFDRWLNEVHLERVDEVEDALYNQAVNGKNTLATLAYLNGNRSDIYKRPGSEMQLTGPGGGPIQVQHTVQIVIPDNGRGDRRDVLEGEYSEVLGLGDGESG